MSETVEIPFPFGGLNESLGNEEQPPRTTVSAQNVRPFDPATGRRRGSQRPGLQKHFSMQPNGSAVPQCLGTAVVINELFLPGAYVYANGAGGQGSARIAKEATGYNSVGPTDSALLMTCWDNNGAAFVASYLTSTSIRINRFDSASDYWVASIGSHLDISGLTVNSTTFAGVAGMVAPGNGILYVWLESVTASGGVSAIYRFNTLDATPYGTNPWLVETTDNLPNPTTGQQLDYAGSLITRSKNCMAFSSGRLYLLGQDLSDPYSPIIQSRSLLDGSLVDEVTVVTASTGDTVNCIRLVDGIDGELYSLVATGSSGAGSTTFQIDRFAPDLGSADWTQSSSSAKSMLDIGIGNNAGEVLVVGSNVFGSAGNSLQRRSATTGASAASATAPASATQWDTVSGYRFYYSGVTYSGYVLGRNAAADNLYIAYTEAPDGGGTSSTANTRSIPLQDQSGPISQNRPHSANVGQPARDVRVICVSGGVITRSTANVIGVPRTVSGYLSSTVTSIFSAQLGRYVYFVDGVNSLRYDTFKDEVEAWSASAGSLPQDPVGGYPRLAEVHQGRLWLSGLKEDPQNWFASAIADGTDFDYSPAQTVATQAVAGNNAEAGLVADVINAMVPFSEDTLLFGGDHSIYALRGNPVTGGLIDQVTNITGMAFGRPWCIDPMGNAWFFGSRGGVYRIDRGLNVQRVTSATIDYRLSTLNLNSTIVRMVWDDRRQGVWLMLTSLQGTDNTHYFYDARTESWWPDVFASVSHIPYAAIVYDGDRSDDRQILLACNDGYIRRFDDAATGDDGTAIDSYVWIGPLSSGGDSQLMLRELMAVLGKDSDSISYDIYTADSAEEALVATAFHSGTWSAGRSLRDNRRTSGHSIYIRLRNSTLNEAWSVERIMAGISRSGISFGRHTR